MVSLAVEEVDKGAGRLSGEGKFGAWLAGGRRPEEAGAAGERPPVWASAAAGFWSGPPAAKNHHWQENRDEIIIIEVISKPVSSIILNKPMEFKLGKNHPPFLKGGQGGISKRLLIPLNPPLGKVDLKPPFPTFTWLRTWLPPQRGFEIGSKD